jgi:hypothetical protein
MLLSLRKLIFTFYSQLNLTATEKTRRKVVDNYMRQMIHVSTFASLINRQVFVSLCHFSHQIKTSDFCLQGVLAGICETAFAT